MLWLLLTACHSDYAIHGTDRVPDPAAPPSGSVQTQRPDEPDEPDEPDMIDPSDATTRGERFWVAYMENLDLAFNGPPEFSLVVTADAATLVEIEVPRTGLVLEHPVEAGATEIALPAGLWYPEGSDVVGDMGFAVNADAPVDLVALHHRLYFSEATRVLPEQELGTAYLVVARSDTLDSGNPSAFVVVATRDGTAVEITPSTATWGLHPGGLPFTVHLDAGQVLQVQATDDLTGTVVASDAPVAVFGGARDAAIDCSATSHSWDQVPPVARWGTAYVVTPFPGQGGDDVTILAAEDGTHVQLDCGEPIALDRGEFHRMHLDARTSVTADGPIQVSQAARGMECSPSGVGDANLLVLSPAALYRQATAFLAVDHPTFDSGGGGDNAGDEHDAGGGGEPGEGVRRDWVTAVVPRGAGVEVDGAFAAVAGGVGSWDVVEVALGPGFHDVASVDGLRGAAVGFSVANAYTYGLGYDCEGCAEDLLRTDHCP